MCWPARTARQYPTIGSHRALEKTRSSCMASPQVLDHFVRERRDLLPAAELGRQLEAGAAHHVALAQHDERALQRGLGERLEPPHASREPGGPPAIERPLRPLPRGHRPGEQRIDRKSTRLNSSHVEISYA